jgi:hypothetical protein
MRPYWQGDARRSPARPGAAVRGKAGKAGGAGLGLAWLGWARQAIGAALRAAAPRRSRSPEPPFFWPSSAVKLRAAPQRHQPGIRTHQRAPVAEIRNGSVFARTSAGSHGGLATERKPVGVPWLDVRGDTRRHAMSRDHKHDCPRCGARMVRIGNDQDCETDGCPACGRMVTRATADRGPPDWRLSNIDIGIPKRD